MIGRWALSRHGSCHPCASIPGTTGYNQACLFAYAPQGPISEATQDNSKGAISWYHHVRQSGRGSRMPGAVALCWSPHGGGFKVQGSSGGTRQSQSCDLLVDFTNQDTSSKLIPSLHPLCELLAERRDKTSLCSRSSCQNRRGQLAETPEPPQKSPGPDAGSESAQHAARSTVLNPGS